MEYGKSPAITDHLANIVPRKGTVFIWANLFSKAISISCPTLENVHHEIDYSSVLVGALVGAATLVTAMTAAVAKSVVLGVTEAVDLVTISLTALGSS